MDQVSYRGYARGTGFDPIKAGYGALDRIQERDSRIIRGMEQHRQAIKDVRDQYGSEMDRKFEVERRSREANYAERQKRRQIRDASIERNARVLAENAANGGVAPEVFQKLAKFSDTLSESLLQYQKQKEESNMMQGYMEVASGQVSPERLQEAADKETALKTLGETQDKIAEGFQARGADPSIITGLLTGNKARDYGRLKAYSEMVTAEFAGYAQTKIDESGASTAAERQAVATQVFEGFLKEKGLFGLNADFMAPALMKMRGSYNALVDDARRADIVNQSSTMRDDALSSVYQSKSGEALNEAFRAISRSYNEDGRTPVGRAKAKALIFDELRDTTRYSDQDVERILSEAITDQGTSWKDRFAREYDDLVLNRRKDAEAESQINDAEQRRAEKRAEEQLIDWVSTKWDGSEDTLKSIITEAKTKGIPTDRLQAYLAQTNEQKNEEFWSKNFEDLYERGLLSAEDVDQPGVPFQLRDTWRSRAVQLDQQRADAGIKQDVIKAELADALKKNLIGDSTSRTPHYSFRGAADYALRLYNQNFQKYVKTETPAKAAEQARLDVLTAIEQGKGRFTVIPSSSAKTGATQAFYAAFTPGKHPGAPSSSDIINESVSIRRFRSNRNIINEELLVSPAVLKDIDNRIQNGRPISVPTLFQNLGRVSGMDPVDILNKQLKAADLKSQVTPSFRQQLNQINDPALQRILNQPLTHDRLNTAINGSGNAPAVVRQGNNGYYDVVALASAAGFSQPHVLAAVWAVSNNLGYTRTSNKNDLFRLGTTYQSPLQATQQLISQVGAVGGTPRDMALSLASALKPNDPSFSNKVVSMMQRMGVNVDASYSTGDYSIDSIREAIIGKESGGDHRAVNKDSGALGIGQVMPANVGPWTKKHLGRTLTPQQFLADKGAQLTVVNGQLNEIYKAQLAAGYDPDIAVRRTAATWYSGQAGLYDDPNPQGGYPSIRDYTKSILTKVQQLSPARNPAYMRPTLAYITDNIGPTSTGDHLDVKQQDNPNTPANEYAGRFNEGVLDNYVLIEDPQFGRIPLGQLRKRLPGRGDNFDQHVARGSHGIDYPAAAGSKVFIQNGARVVSKQRTKHGDKVVIQLPDGRRFSFLHGRMV